MVFFRSNWERLAEFWDISEIANIVSRALVSFYAVKIGVTREHINMRELIKNIALEALKT